MRKQLLVLLLPILSCYSSTPFLNLPEGDSSPWTHLNANDSADLFQFVIMSDRTGGHRPGVFLRAVQQINLLQPEFVIGIGDLIEGYTDDVSTLNAEWDEFEKIIAQFEVPYFYVAGNHDLTNKTMEDLYRVRHGASYYHFVYKNCLFLVICTEDPAHGNISNEQVDYMKKALAANSDVRWTFIFMHTPLFTHDLDGRAPHGAWIQIEEKIATRPHTVFSGHFHTYCKFEKHDQSYFILGTTGGGSMLRGREFGEVDHFTWVTMSDAGPRIANILLDSVFDENMATEKTLNFSGTLLKTPAVAGSPLFVDTPEFTKGTVRLHLKNKTKYAAHFFITLTADPVLELSESRFFEILAVGEEKNVDVPVFAQVPLAPDYLSPIQIQYTVDPIDAGELQKVTRETFAGIVKKYPCLPIKKVMIDGILDEWGELPIQIKNPTLIGKQASAYTGATDSHFYFGTRYDADFLYIAVEVFDDHIMRLEDSFVWDQDGVEIRLLALPEPERSLFIGANESDWHEILPLLITPPNTVGEITIWNEMRLPAGTELISKRTKTGYIVEVAIPSKHLTDQQGAPWTEFRLALAINDSDEEGVVSQLGWKLDLRDETTYSGSGTFQKIP